jgi:2-polyprenyl-3-methyl-5-hydroxy-6-metoxy-1,4-benzoquinol methylase
MRWKTVDVDFLCPVCDCETWFPVGVHYYWRAEHQEDGNWYRSQYVRRRRRVLFDLWFPGAVWVALSSRCCAACGLTCYSPRPDDSDLEAKYRFLGEMEKDLADTDAPRAARIFEAVSAVQTSPTRVLDVGGSDGRMMLPFLAQGAQCFLVDYKNWTHQGIERLGATISEVPKTMIFDVIICSHVLEHVAHPRGLLESIIQRMHDDGTLYVEVPREVFRSNVRNPIMAEPVTHINFFTADSLRRVLFVAGYQTDTVEECESTYEGRPLPVIRAVAAKANSAVTYGDT